MNLQTTDKAGALIAFAAVIVVVYGLQMAKVLMVPLLLATFIALITVRPMLWMQRHRVPAVLAALIIVIVIMLILTFVGSIVGRSVAQFTAALPEYQQRLDGIVRGVLEFVVEHLGVDESVDTLGDLVNPGWAMGLAANILNGVRDVLTNVFLIFFTVVFILLEASTLRTKMEAAFGAREGSLEKPKLFLSNLGRYLSIKTLVSIATGLLAWGLTSAIGLDFPQLWGMLAFLLNYVPTIGSIIAAVPAILLALVQIGPEAATATMIGFVMINIMFGNLIEPRLMGYGVGISPLIVFVGLVFWGWVFGPVGMLLSVPLTMTLKLWLEGDESTRWIAILIGSERDAQHDVAERKQDADEAEEPEPSQIGS
ncbi:MAG: AI-2E family transporter [Woeseiaceae bacterium]|nr:AI-2E family transporter [Woeseiaceae bacterium]